MHRKYARDGFEVVGVTLDDPRDKMAIEGAKRFLETKLKPPFRNVNLDPKTSDWEKRLKTNGVPCIFVFNRDNHHVKRMPLLDDKGEEKEEVDYDVMEKVVDNLMKK